MFAACGWESAAPIARPIMLSLTTDLGCPPTPALSVVLRGIGRGPQGHASRDNLPGEHG